METITGMAQTAAKAVWGNGTERDEPISGVQGDVSKGEPFDGGNIDPLESSKRGSEFETETSNELKKSSSNTKDPAIGTETSKELKNNNGTKDPAIGTEASKELKNSNGTKDPVVSTDEPAPAEKPPSRDTSDSNAADAGGDGEEGVMGDGPRPLATVAKECGGDAGNMKPEPEPESQSSGDAAAGKDGDGDGEGKGTGELYVKASGLAADGGDFDAAKPGAGREADRLMEENGIKREAGDDSKPSKLDSMSSGSGSKDDNEKLSMKDRIKDKLHLHKS
ncbi:hypothetical protein C2857_001633 [Epichloe festucae Fl1]|uniref:Glycine-rich cell wall structural protein 1 n=1 Tax=Epichloe festucae (strain Fl1) TaxID=877507 RepID=A0A7U3Q1I3_EPIFF|nr:hypothetical protein C2857_001633 [Epichloe festucae Fl1]